MEIYTVFEDEAFEYYGTFKALMSFTTETAAQSYLKVLINDIRNKWKTIDDFGLYEDMRTTEEPNRFEIWLPNKSAAFHTYLTIYKTTLVGM